MSKAVARLVVSVSPVAFGGLGVVLATGYCRQIWTRLGDLPLFMVRIYAACASFCLALDILLLVFGMMLYFSQGPWLKLLYYLLLLEIVYWVGFIIFLPILVILDLTVPETTTDL